MLYKWIESTYWTLRNEYVVLRYRVMKLLGREVEMPKEIFIKLLGSKSKVKTYDWNELLAKIKAQRGPFTAMGLSEVVAHSKRRIEHLLDRLVREGYLVSVDRDDGRWYMVR